LDFNGLSIDQAPPISAPLRFFLTAPLFAMVAGFLVLFTDPEILLSRFSLESIAITHAITIGFFGFVMLGALMQMLPVLAGVKIANIKSVSKYTHLSLIFGLISLLLGFYQGEEIFYLMAMLGLGLGFLTLISFIALSMQEVKNFTPTVKNMAISLAFAFCSVLFGLLLLGEYISDDLSSMHMFLANVHSVWAIFGFAGILLIGVAFQILPMFYVAPNFKEFCLSKVAKIIAGGLLLWFLLNLFLPSYAFVAKIWIALFFWAFATTAWLKLNKRKRKVSDITIWYWRVAAISLTLGSFFWIFDEYFNSEYTVLVALFFGLGFLLSIMMGMLYKIIPFLVWFHLNGAGYMSIPTMNEMIDKRLSKLQFFLFLFSSLGFVVSFFFSEYLWFFALTFIISMAILEYNIATCALLYAKIKKTKPDFDMSAFK
jgi:hypothetical protein